MSNGNTTITVFVFEKQIFCSEYANMPNAPKVLAAFHASEHYTFGLETSGTATEFVSTILDLFYCIVTDKSLKKLEPIPVISKEESLSAQKEALMEVGSPRLLTGGGIEGQPPLEPRVILRYIQRVRQ